MKQIQHFTNDISHYLSFKSVQTLGMYKVHHAPYDLNLLLKHLLFLHSDHVKQISLTLDDICIFESCLLQFSNPRFNFFIGETFQD